MRRSARHLALAVLTTALTLSVAACSQVPGATAAESGAALERATPESVGMSSERLAHLHDAMQALVDDGRLAGITTLIGRRGQIADFRTYGHRDVEAGDPMAEDAIFRIYSMSKPITGVALMILYEEGEFGLDDPVEDYIPEFEGLQVAASFGPDGPVLEDAEHPMTIRELMTHTAGLAYGIGSPHPVDRLYQQRRVLSNDQTLADMVDKLAELPLRQQPGSQWTYSIAVDVQGRLVEVLSGQPFDVFLQERIFDPLGMVDTGFHVPEADHHRFAQVYGYGESGELMAPPTPDAANGPRPYLDPTTFFSGGGGLVSTTLDYARFCQMMLNGGELNGVRILSPTTVDLMRRDHLPQVGLEEGLGGGGFGLDFAVVLDPSEAGSVGEYSWGGAAGTWFWIDPVEDLYFVGMIQHFGAGRPDVRGISHQLTYQAITDSNATN